MSAARDRILGRVRSALGRGPLDDATRAELDRRLATPSSRLIPARAQIGRDAQLALFVQMAEAADTTVVRVAGMDDVPAAVCDYLASQNLPSEAALEPDPKLAHVPWHIRPLLTLRRGGTDGSDQVAITGAHAGVAETGTLVKKSGEHSPTLLNFLPETQIVILRASEIRGTYEDVFTAMREAGGTDGDAGFMPRTVNLITGPSRSGDIEQTLLLGAHGPRRLHVIMVDDAAA